MLWKKLAFAATAIIFLCILARAFVYNHHRVVIVTPENYRGFLFLVEDRKARDFRPLLGSSIWRADWRGNIRIKDRDELVEEWHSFEAKYPSGKVIHWASALEPGLESRFKGDTTLYLFTKGSSPSASGQYFFIGTIPEAVKNGYFFYRYP